MLGVEKVGSEFEFLELEWDTRFFGVSCAKAVLHHPLTLTQWAALKSQCLKYEFVCIMNRNAEPINAQYIGRETSAFLADVNLQFVKDLRREELLYSADVEICLIPEDVESLLGLARFGFSRFVEDPELLKRGGDRVHREWIENAARRTDKHFAIARDGGETVGFLLHSYLEDCCVVELLAVSSVAMGRGVGSSLFRSVEYDAFHRGAKKMLVGTQVRNLRAINLYRKLGCKLVGCHQVYHMWNN